MEIQVPRNFFSSLCRNRYYQRAFINYTLKGYRPTDYREATNDIKTIIYDCLKRRDNDTAILLKIVHYLSKYPYSLDTDSRVDDRVSTITSLVERPVRSYLDYGCGDGSITRKIAAVYGLKSENVYGVDTYANVIPGVSYIRGLPTKVESGSIDLITALVSLHHIPAVRDVLREIHRVLSPGGMLVIREHDYNENTTMMHFLHLIHMFVDVRDHGTCDWNTLIGETSYFPKAYWTTLIVEAGFTFVKSVTYEGNNPQELYYACYTRNA